MTPNLRSVEEVEQQLHNYGAWLLNNPDAGPLERRAEKNNRATTLVSTLATVLIAGLEEVKYPDPKSDRAKNFNRGVDEAIALIKATLDVTSEEK